MAKKMAAWPALALLVFGIPALAGEIATPAVEEPTTFHLLEVDGEVPTTTEGLIALLNGEDVENVAMCGGQCGDGYCICSGSDDCCDDLCDYGCGLCFDPPCVVIADDVE